MGKNETPKTTMMASFSPSKDQDETFARVLIVDDSPQVLQDLHQLLELTGLIEIVAEAHNGLEAIRLAEDFHPDVVVMDLEMPVMDGFEATRQIKSQQLARRVIILSVHSDTGEIERSQAAGADGFVVKGASYEILVNAILGKDRPPDSFNPGEGEKS